MDDWVPTAFRSLKWQEPGAAASSYHASWPGGKRTLSMALAVLCCVTIGYGFHTQRACVPTPPGQSDAWVRRTFELNRTFIEAPSPDTDAAWDELVPRGRGFIAIGHTGAPIRFQGGEVADVSRIRTVSVFHQLHCLNELRIGYYAMSASTRNGEPADHVHGGGHRHSPAHMKHCFDYIRQALMCAGDATLERLEVGLDTDAPAADGWGTEHQCRDFGELARWTEDHRATDASGIM